jgi:hypothetical protein
MIWAISHPRIAAKTGFMLCCMGSLFRTIFMLLLP